MGLSGLNLIRQSGAPTADLWAKFSRETRLRPIPFAAGCAWPDILPPGMRMMAAMHNPEPGQAAYAVTGSAECGAMLPGCRALPGTRVYLWLRG